MKNAYPHVHVGVLSKTPNWNAVKFGAHFPPFFLRLPTDVLVTQNADMYILFEKKETHDIFYFFLQEKNI